MAISVAEGSFSLILSWRLNALRWCFLLLAAIVVQAMLPSAMKNLLSPPSMDARITCGLVSLRGVLSYLRGLNDPAKFQAWSPELVEDPATPSKFLGIRIHSLLLARRTFYHWTVSSQVIFDGMTFLSNSCDRIVLLEDRIARTQVPLGVGILSNPAAEGA